MDKKKILILFTHSHMTKYKESVTQQTVSDIENILKDKYNVYSHAFNGFSTLFNNYIKTFDCVFNICYGYYKENEIDISQVDIVKYLDDNNIKHNVSKYDASVLAMDKSLYDNITINLDGIYSPKNALLFDIKTNVIKKPKCGSCHRNMELLNSSKDIVKFDNSFIYQEYIQGREFSVFVINTKNGINILKPYEIISNENQNVFIFGDKTSYNVNPFIDKIILDNINNVMYKIHDKYNFIGITRTDLRLSNDNILYLLDINSMPNLDKKLTIIDKVLINSGTTYEQIITEIVEI